MAFALTDFKLQGRTLSKLILCLADRKKPPWISLAAFYVFISRVRRAESLRLLQYNANALDKIGKLRHDDYLACWERGYNTDGWWSDERAAQIWNCLKAQRDALVAATREETEAAGKRKREAQVQARREAAKKVKHMATMSNAGAAASVSDGSGQRWCAPQRQSVPVAPGKRQACRIDAAAAPEQVSTHAASRFGPFGNEAMMSGAGDAGEGMQHAGATFMYSGSTRTLGREHRASRNDLQPHQGVPHSVGAFARFEFKYPFLWWHSQFDWPLSVQCETMRALKAARSPSQCRVWCPGRSGTVLVTKDDKIVEERLAALAPRAAAAYFRQLLEPHAVRLVQALVRGWLTRRHQKPLQRVSLHLRRNGLEEAHGDSDGIIHFRNADSLARLHPFANDAHLTFEEASHHYTAWGQCVQRSCTTLIASFFDGFDPESVTAAHFERWKDDPSSAYHTLIRHELAAGGCDADVAARIRNEWAERGDIASRLGTALHHFIECELNGTPIAPPAGLATEVQHFNDWKRSHVVQEFKLMPYRTELTVAARACDVVVCAGQIDALFIDKHGFFYMIDWKRTAKSLDPHASAFGRTGSGPLRHVPANPYHKYSLQLSLYSLMLEETHGVRCQGGLFLIRLHAAYQTFEVVQCCDMREEAKALLDYERERLLSERKSV